MIISFTVKNFKSFKGENTLYMTPVGKIKGLEQNIHTINSNFKISKESNNKLLKIATINGQNASGKSNFIEAISFMKECIKDSFAKLTNENPIKKLNPFMFGDPEASSYFELSFVLENINYIYSFEITKNEVLNEKLIKNDKGVEKLFFERTGGNIKLGNKNNIDKTALSTLKNTIEKRKEVLVLSMLSVLGIDELALISIYFESNLIVYNNNTDILKTIAEGVKIHSDSMSSFLFEKMKKFISSLDVRIINIEIAEDLNQDYPFIAVHHNKFTNSHIKTTIKLPFSQESEGTKKLLKTSAYILACLRTEGKVFLVDELDDKIHTNLFIELIKLFQDSDSQFIFATHNPYIMEQDLLRNDQIYFIDKNELEESELYSLSDFKGVRKDYSKQKRYLNGNFGAIPIIDFTELKESLFNKGENNG